MLHAIEMKVFGGRTDRVGLWGAFVLLLIAYLIAATVLGASIDLKSQAFGLKQTFPAILIGFVGLTIFVRALGRRLHDLGLTGWLALAVVPFVDIVSRQTVGEDQLTLTLNPILALTSYTVGVNDWPATIEWLREIVSFRVSLGHSVVRLSGPIFAIVGCLGVIKGRRGSNAYGPDLKAQTQAPTPT